MTVPAEPFTESPNPDLDDVVIVDVRLIEDATPTKAVTADFGGYSTRADIPDVTLGVPIPVLMRAINRHRAFLKVTTLTGGTTPAVRISSSRESLQAGGGYSMFAGDTVEIKNQQPLYAVTAGVPAAVSVSILDERWESDTE